METFEELNQKIADLVLENDRIKKTSKQRFEKIKKLESNKAYVDGELYKIKCINEFLVDNEFPLKVRGGLPMINHSVFNAINSLKQKSVTLKKPEVNGTYAVKIDGLWYIKNVVHNICWRFVEGCSGNTVGIHLYNTEEFILLEAK